jgi:hypothetical protein
MVIGIGSDRQWNNALKMRGALHLEQSSLGAIAARGLKITAHLSAR